MDLNVECAASVLGLFFLVDLFVPELNPHHQNDLFDLSNILLIGQFVNLVIITSQLFLPPVEN